jgi:hypothetical protein
VCDFPRLRHLSLSSISPYGLQELAGRSPNLESLLISSNWIGSRIDVTLFPCLRLLGLPDGYIVFDRVDFDHPLEHIWLYSTAMYINHGLIIQLAKKLPNMSRITVKLLSASWQEYMERAEEYRWANFESIGLITRPITDGDIHIIIERIDKGL